MDKVKSLCKPGETVLLSVDNSVAFSYLTKSGGRLPHLNLVIRPFITWCLENQISLQVQWVPSEEMLADGLSRWSVDKGDYTLDREVFWGLQEQFRPWLQPVVEMFASPGNLQISQFFSRWPHHQAVAVDALRCPLQDFREVYANPPWSIVQPWLHRLRENPHITCLLVCPYWVSATWWPQLIRLHVPKTPCFLIPPFHGMFRNCQNQSMPQPRWPLVSLLLSGSCWRDNKLTLRPLINFWEA